MAIREMPTPVYRNLRLEHDVEKGCCGLGVGRGRRRPRPGQERERRSQDEVHVVRGRNDRWTRKNSCSFRVRQGRVAQLFPMQYALPPISCSFIGFPRPSRVSIISALQVRSRTPHWHSKSVARKMHLNGEHRRRRRPVRISPPRLATSPRCSRRRRRARLPKASR